MLVFGTCFAQPVFWMQRGSGLSVDEGADVAIDNAGNAYFTGYFTASCDFEATTLTGAGLTDVFLTKVDGTGHVEWAVSAGGNQPDRAVSVAAHPSGDVIVAGFYSGLASFGPVDLNSASGSQDIFVARYNSSGNVVWAQSFGGAGGEQVSDVAVSPGGRILVAGEFAGSSQFGPTALNSMNGSTDAFLLSLDENGTVEWVKQGAAPQTDRSLGVAVGGDGDAYVMGQYSDTITWDGTYNNNINNAIFLLSYDSLGNEQWFRRIAGGVSGIAYGIGTGPNNDIYLSGDFAGTLTLYGTPNVTATNPLANSSFLARYNSSGVVD